MKKRLVAQSWRQRCRRALDDDGDGPAQAKRDGVFAVTFAQAFSQSQMTRLWRSTILSLKHWINSLSTALFASQSTGRQGSWAALLLLSNMKGLILPLLSAFSTSIYASPPRPGPRRVPNQLPLMPTEFRQWIDRRESSWLRLSSAIPSRVTLGAWARPAAY